MATQVQNRRGTTAEHATFTGAVGEVTVDTTKDTVVVHDGSTAGGAPLLREDQSNLPTSAPTTGVYNNSGALALSTNGVQRINIEADGDINIDSGGVFYDATNNRLAIGTTSPDTPLNVVATSAGSSATVLGLENLGTTVNTATTLALRTYTGSSGTRAASAIQSIGTDTSGGTALTFITNSTSERARIDSSGRLLVGTSTAIAAPIYPYAPTNRYSAGLQRHAASVDASQLIGCWQASANVSAMLGFAKSNSGTVGTYGTALIAGTRIGSITFSGDDSAKFVLGAAIEAFADAAWGVDDGPTRLVFSTNPGSPATAPVERMRIDSADHVNFGATAFFGTNTYASVDGTSNNSEINGRLRNSSTDTTSTRAHNNFYNSNGLVGTITTSGSATAYNTSSDYRLKENVTPVTDGITRLQQLKPSRFNFIADPDKTVDGFLAHEVQTIVPEAITGEKDAVDEDGNPEYQGIDQSKLVPLLTAALQEAIGRIETLEAEVAALKAS